MSGTISSDEGSLREFFKEYERLTKMSGLELNADKTELLNIGKNAIERRYNVRYLNKRYSIDSLVEVKINGLLLCRNLNDLRERNVASVAAKMERHFGSWMRRGLSLLGKVLIAKTFGLSQAIYLMQTIKLAENDFKKINAVIYKFLWNRHFHAAKAPERIKREIMCKSSALGGFGMLDTAELDCSLKLRALGRLMSSEHPFMRILKRKIDLNNFFSPTVSLTVESVLNKGLELLAIDRNKLWCCRNLNGNKALLVAIRNSKKRPLLSDAGRNSIPFYVISRQASLIRHLNGA